MTNIISEKPKGNYRLILTALIVCDEFLYKFSNKHKEDFFQATFAQKICKWCLDFYSKYNEAPKSHIQDIYDTAIRENNIQMSELELIEDLLNSIDEEYDDNDFNIDYLLDETKKLQKEQNLETLKAELNKINDYDEAKELYEKKIIIEDSNEVEFIEPLKEKDIYEKINKAKPKPLINLGGAFGELLDKEIYRGAYLNIRSCPKTGKTFLATEIVNRSIIASRNVVYFQCGDLNEGQALRRCFSVIGGLSRTPLDKTHTRPFIDCKYNQNDSCGIYNRKTIGKSIIDDEGTLLPIEQIPEEYEPCDYCHIKGKDFPRTIFHKPYPYNKSFNEEIIAKIQKRALLRLRNNHFYLLPVVSRSISMTGIKERLLKLRKETGFSPDIVVIDYEGILDIEPSTKATTQKRFDKALKCSIARNISFIFDCATIVFEQSNRVGYNSPVMLIDHASEARESNDEPTCVCGLVADRKNKTIRVNVCASREYDFDECNSVVLLPDLACGKINLDSYWEYVILDNKKYIKNNEKDNKTIDKKEK